MLIKLNIQATILGTHSRETPREEVLVRKAELPKLKEGMLKVRLE